MDYIEVATRIAGAENPYSEFEKEASSLNDIEKTSLARALNKQMFLSRLEDRDGDGHLDFEVVVPETIGTHVPKSDIESKMSKTASTKDAVDKSLLVTDDMFVLEGRRSRDFSTKYDTSDLQEMTIKTAEQISDKELIKTAEELRVHRIEKKAEIEAKILPLMETLVKTARDASETRTLVMHAIDARQEDLIPSIVSMSRSSESDIGNADLCDLGDDKVAKIKDILGDIEKHKEAYALVDGATTKEDVDKVAAVPFVAKALWSGIKGGSKMLFGAGKTVGKTAWKVGNNNKASTAITGGVTAAAVSDKSKDRILQQIM